jgi:hypothetical protein
MVAAIKMVGSYSAGDFHITSGNGGTIAITDPVVNGGSVERGVSDFTFGAHTTLAYSENSTTPSVGVTEGRYAAALALLGNYMAGSFATTAGGHGGTLVSGTPQTEQQSLFTHPSVYLFAIWKSIIGGQG